MKNMKTFTIKKKLLTGFLVLIALNVVVFVIGVRGMISVNNDAERMYHHYRQTDFVNGYSKRRGASNKGNRR